FFTASRSFTDPALGFRITQRFWSLRGTSSQALFPKHFLYVAHFVLHLASDFLGCSSVPQIGIANRFPCLLFDFSFSFVDPAFDFILCTRVHIFNSGFSPSSSGSLGKCVIIT